MHRVARWVIATVVLVTFASAMVAVRARAAAVKPVEKSSTDKATDPFGIAKRVPWTTSKVLGSPEPPDAYRVERVYPRIKMDRSLDLQLSPDGDRWFVLEDPGTIWTFPVDEKSAERADLFMDLRRKDWRYLQWNEQRRFWSMTFHPKYKENGYVYVCYLDPKPGPVRNRISRFTVDLANVGTPPTCDADSEMVICEWNAGEDHFGGCLRFGPDGMLYCSTGDGSGYGDFHGGGQSLDDLHASVLRIDVDHQDWGRSYSIPKDNPFVDRAHARGEVWAYGMRNFWKMTFDRETGDLWAGDVGQDLWDSIDLVEKGNNFGWSIVEGSEPFLPDRERGKDPFTKPVISHNHTESRSITGGFVYRGTKLKDLIGRYVYGDYETGKIWALKYDKQSKKLLEHRELANTTVKIVCFAEDADGELQILDYNGTIYHIVPNDRGEEAAVASFPQLLSQTGLFASTKGDKVAAGLIPYSVNAPLWSDGALKERFIAVPGDAKIDYDTGQSWKFPEGSVLVKTFSLQMDAADPKSVRRLETRLMHYEKGQWHGYTYIWNDEQTDAKLLGKDPLEKTYTIKDAAAPDGVRKQTWHYPGRTECTLCHTMASGYALGLSTVQMNKSEEYGDGIVDNQIRTLDHIGLFAKPLAAYYKPRKGEMGLDGQPLPIPQTFKDLKLPKLANPDDEHEPLEARARAYMQANCAHCHRRWGGGNSQWQVQWDVPTGATGIVNADPAHGDLHIKDAKLIAPGAPDRSMMLQRMLLLDKQRMPRVASNVIDDKGVALMKAWIEEMGKPQK